VNQVKVKGGEMMIHEQYGRVKYVSGRYMTMQVVPVIDTMTESKALEQALKHVNSTTYLWLQTETEQALKESKKDTKATYYPKGELQFVPDPSNQKELNFELCWRFDIHVLPLTESYEVYIKAGSGEFFNKIPLTFACSTGSCTTLWNGVQTIYTQLNAGTYRTIDACPSGNGADIHTMNGNGSNSGVGATYYTDADNAWSASTLARYVTQTHWSIRNSRIYFENVHSRTGYDDAGHDYTAYINPGFNNNAFYSSSTEAVSFGGNSNGDSALVSLDIAGHECTHGMIDFTSDLVYQNESGALNESFADIFGEVIERYTTGSNNWRIATETWFGTIRTMSNPKANGDPDTYQGTNWVTTGCASPSNSNDFCGVHTNSGVQNFWFFLLSEGGTGTNDNGSTYNVTGIGMNKARLIAYDCMGALSSNATYSNARSMSIQKAKDRYGNCSEEAEQTTRAWFAVGVGSNWVNPIPLSISVTTSATSVCPGDPVTITAFGATSYVWSPGGTSGNPKIFNPTFTSTYTVTGTNAEQCTGSKTFTIYVNPIPTVSATISDNEICVGQSTTLGAGTNQTLREVVTETTGTNGAQGNVFNIYAYNNITITDLKMVVLSGDSAEVYYNPGGYGNADVTSTSGWTKLGATVPIIAGGTGVLTTIPTTSNLTIPAGNTYGIMVVCNGSNRYSNGTAVGSILESNADLYLTEGHGGSGFGGSFNFTFSPRAFNGSVVYRVNYTDYSWSPATTLSSSTAASPVATPASSTTYTVTVTDGNGCTATGTIKSFVYPKPVVTTTTASPNIICAGNTSQLNVTGTVYSSTQSLLTTLNSNNGASGNVFNITALNSILITNVRMNILNGDSAEVWYKAGGYGNSSVTSSVGWTKLGNTVAITPAGGGALTLIPTSANLSIPAGATYGLAVVVNGSNRYTNGTGVGNLIEENADLQIFEGHGGNGFGGAFSFTLSPRIFNGQIDYTAINSVASYSWSPNFGTLSSSALQNPVADPRVSTEYRAIMTDVHGCRDTGFVNVFVDPKPMVQVNVNPVGICPGDSAQISSNVDFVETDSLFTTTDDNNGFGLNGGVVFDITTNNKPIVLTKFKMNIDTGATQAKVFYKVGGYGGANVTTGTGWIQLGATVAISPAGQGNLTTIPITTTLTVPASSTYGLIVVTNGNVNYTNGTAVGNVFASNPDLSIKEGHAGSGFTTGTFNYINSPRVFNGEIVYNVSNTITSYSWTPNTNMNNSTISNPKASPLSTTTYTVTVSDINGCTGTAVAGVVVNPLPTLGTATASPANLCLGSSTNLSYTQPAGIGCYGAYQSGFAGTYAPSNWTISHTNSNGTVNTAGAPGSIVLTSSNNISFLSGQTTYAIPITCNGILSFNWNYSTIDDAGSDYPRYSTNGVSWDVFPGHLNTLGEPQQQQGTFTLPVTAGTTFYVQAYTTENLGGSATITLSNFKAPYQTTASQQVVWYSAASGGSNLGNGNPQSHAPAAAGNYTYYAQVSSSATGCTNPTRVATNIVNVGTLPVLNTSASASTICAGNSTTLSASGASSYIWNPGLLIGANIVVSPAVTTTYTVTGTNNGCSATATRTITVNPAPAVTTATSNASIPCGASTTITANGANSYVWQPGGMTTAAINVSPLVTTTYTVTGTAANGCTHSTTRTITVTTACGTTVNVKLFIEGYYTGGGLMTPVLQNQGVLGASSSQTDTITVELRNTVPPYTIAASQQRILNTNGTSTGTFNVSGNYYLAIKHRNALQTWSANPVNLVGGTLSYDFSNALNKAFGNNQVNLGGGVFGFYTGDVAIDENIDLSDLGMIEIDISNFAFGYEETDINGDGNVDILDTPVVEDNINNFIFSVHP
jgi:Zn-dependent metalloprotease